MFKCWSWFSLHRSMSFFDSKTCLSLRVLYLEERLFSHCCSSQTLQDKPLLEKKFFRSNAKDSKVHHLCKEKKFKEAIHILCDQKRLRDAVRLLDQIERPSALVYSTLLQFCLKQRDVGAGKMVHGHMGKAGFLPGVVISNRLIDMYMKCDNLVDAQKTFDEMPQRDLCSWNTMISGYARAGRLSDARKLFDEMPERDNFSWTAMMSGYVRHDMPLEAIELFRMMQMLEIPMSSKFTFSSALAATAAILCLRKGKEIHGHILRLGLESDEVVWSALSDMYGKCGSVEEARHIFDRMVERDVVTWTAMIDRYFGDGRTEKGFMLFSELMCSKVRPNEFTFAGVLNACADHAAEQIGNQVHGYMMRTGFDPSSFAVSALVHMYSKCGNMESAERAFKGMPHPDLVSWTSLIVGFAQNGLPREALKYFDMLVESGIRPDHITFIGVLSACTHAGLVDKGLQYFHSITEQHGLTHTPDHYACIVDLLARSGRFKEAEEIISTMPMKPDRFLWASLLGGCRIHRNMELAKRASEELYQIEPDNPATYITMANMYATASMWDEVTKIREIMEDRGVVKKPGLSWTQIGRKQHVFLVGDTSHPKSNEIHVFLTEISKRMKEEGYVPDTNFVLHDVEEEQKEQNLAFHSEKLAVAYGILSTSPGTSVKVFKNLRTCVDCHNAIKFISKIMKRKIIVRDSNRFHCFENGICSCGEYW